MIRVRCPHCRELLELDRPVPMFLCPACNQTCRLPATVAPKPQEEILDVIAVEEEPRRSRRGDEITAAEPDERRSRTSTSRRRPEDEGDDDIDLEVVEDGDERRRRQRKRRRRPRRRSTGGGGIDLDWVNLPFILLIVLGFPGLIFVVLLFLVSPLAGLVSIPMVATWIWMLVIVSEDGILELVLYMFVPFYWLYWTFNNWDRVSIPFLGWVVSFILFCVMLATQARHAADRMEMPPPTPVHLAHLWRAEDYVGWQRV